jgi:hypothetical protein
MKPKPKSLLEEGFEGAMYDTYRCADEECDYRPTYLLRMLNDHGGLETAKILLAKSDVSEGFVRLALLGRLDPAVESLVLNPNWKSPFTDDELLIARRRLR